MNLKLNRFINEFNFILFSNYLKKYGWNNDGKYNEIFTIWHRLEPDQTEYELIVPENNQFKKNEETFFQIFENLAVYYNKSISLIIDDYLNSVNDKVKLSIKSKTTQDGIIPLTDGVRLIENTKEMLVSSFLAIRKRKKNFMGPRPDSVNEVINNIQLGQTEEGSFVLNIFVPKYYYEDEDGRLIDSTEESFTRKALNVLENSVVDLVTKANEYQTNNDISIFDSAYQSGVSSNLCNAISEISSNGKHDINISISYNNGIDKSEDIKSIDIKREFIPLINDVREYYKKDLSEENYRITGYVTKLHQEPTEEEGEITLTSIIEGKLKKVKMVLNPDNYLIAQEAHKTKQFLSCVGTINMKDRQTTLTDISSVLLVEED